MRLTVFTDYALRTLTYVALDRAELSTISDMSRAYGISRNHLMKVVRKLGALGYLTTVRGKHGGVKLSKAPEEINIADVVGDCEGSPELVECFRPNGGCAIEAACVLRSVLYDAHDAFMAELGRYSLRDLIEPQRKLRQLLDLSS